MLACNLSHTRPVMSFIICCKKSYFMFILVIFQSLEATYILKTHVQGVINHGQNRFFPFIDINEYCHDANLVVNTVLKVLKESIGKASTEISLYSFRC